MRKNISLLLAGATFLAFVGSISAGEPQNTIYVHGFQTFRWQGSALKSCQGKTTCTKYWDKGQATHSSRNQVRHVGWYASNAWPYYGSPQLISMLNSYCRSQTCRIICHSTGCPVTGHVIANYGYRYRIAYVAGLGSAEGGSELATALSVVKVALRGAGWWAGALAELFTGSGSYFLIPSVTRSWYNHNNNRGVPFYLKPGRNAGFGSVVIWPAAGRNDGVVAFHSACGYSSKVWTRNCSSTWKFCWKRGSKKVWRWRVRYKYPSTCGVPKWRGHYSRGGSDAYGVDHSGTTQKKYHGR